MRFVARLTAILTGFLITHLALADSQQPQRWVSAGGALTEWVVTLGGQSHLVGIDTTSQHPESIKSLPSIGYQRQLSSEGILSLRPNVLIGTEEMGPPPVLAQLRTAGVKVEVFSAAAEVSALQGNLQKLGKLLGDEDQARQVADQYVRQLDSQHDWVARAQQHQTAPGVLLLVSHAGAAPMVAGAGTVGDWLIKQAGGRNLATHNGYKIFSAEAMAGLNPEVLVFTDRAQNGASSRDALMRENPLLAATQAVRNKRVLEVDPTLLVGGLGPRLPEAMQALSRAFYPADSSLNAKVTPAQ
ncbi:ABC transporter substrate-binding protein [Pseudomonas putida]|jgi:iron complex transport system substrate-binding protein|uniref:heme/hemin ABC transporter substrate-binding protein n=1 Tax=Pseudomonas putida TaxID=303 RepID=UPI002363EF46|nr:ABC transporter substrate-binding protein [Pseudomonas putida]MDD1967804.1 ABC transporter substrate-binding protein [Pseudomonas putida]